jgi:hypothetical protein
MHRREALVQWAQARESQRQESDRAVAVKYVAALGVEPNVTFFSKGQLPTTRPTAAPASYQFTVGGSLLWFPPPAVDRVVLFEVQSLGGNNLVAVAHQLEWEAGEWREEGAQPDAATSATTSESSMIIRR